MNINDLDFKIERKLAFHSDCTKELHTYYKSPHNEGGVILCSKCKSKSVHWHLTKSRDITRIQQVIIELKKEWWRNFWWQVPIKEDDLLKALELPMEKLQKRVEKRISSSVGRVYVFNGKIQPFNDGYQTPYSGNIIYYAQHAMATCCRFCIDYWHGIPRGRELSTEEIKYLAFLTSYYVEKRLKHERPRDN